MRRIVYRMKGVGSFNMFVALQKISTLKVQKDTRVFFIHRERVILYRQDFYYLKNFLPPVIRLEV